jgi:hypothetical protein
LFLRRFKRLWRRNNRLLCSWSSRKICYEISCLNLNISFAQSWCAEKYNNPVVLVPYAIVSCESYASHVLTCPCLNKWIWIYLIGLFLENVLCTCFIKRRGCDLKKYRTKQTDKKRKEAREVPRKRKNKERFYVHFSSF